MMSSIDQTTLKTDRSYIKSTIDLNNSDFKDTKNPRKEW